MYFIISLKNFILRNIAVLFFIIPIFFLGFQYIQAAWVLSPWELPENLQTYELSDTVNVTGFWNLNSGEAAIVRIYINGIEKSRLYFNEEVSGPTGNFTVSYDAHALGSGDYSIVLDETRALVVDCPSVNNCSGTYALWLSRNFTINTNPDPLFVFNVGNSINFNNVGINDSPAIATFTATNVGSDMAVGTYDITTTNLDTSGVYTCIEVAGSVCSYSQLAQGETIKVTVQFDPTIAGHEDGFINFERGGSLSNQQVTLDGDGVFVTGPYIAVRNENIPHDSTGLPVGYYNEGENIAMQFMDMYTGRSMCDSCNLDLRIHNLGTETLNGTVSGFSATNDFKLRTANNVSWTGASQNSPLSYSVDPGSTALVVIEFEPESLNIGDTERSQQFIFTNEATGGQVVLDLRGMAIDTPILDVHTTNYDFGNVMIGTTIQSAFRIQNDGGNTLTSTTTVNSSSGYFTGLLGGIPCITCIVTGLRYNEVYNQVNEWGVQFTPQSYGQFTGIVEYNSNGGVTQRNIIGTGIELIVESRDTVTATVDYILGIGHVINFGDVLLGDSVTAEFDISSHISASSNITGSFIVNDTLSEFGYIAPNTYDIAPGGSDIVTLTFIPSLLNGIGLRNGTITFDGLPDLPSGEITFDLIANVVEPQLHVNPELYKYHITEVGATTTRVLRVENIGSGTLTGSVSTTGPFYCNPDFELNQIKTLDSFGPTWVGGASGTALNFVDEYERDDYVRIDNSSSLTIDGDQITVSAWVRMNDSQLNDAGILIKRHGSSYPLHLGIEGSTSIQMNLPNFRLVTSDRSYRANGDVGLTQGKWYHLVGVYDGEYAYIYLNGEEVSKEALIGNISTNSSPVLIARRSDSGDNRYLNGAVDEVRIYNKALSLGEIQSLYRKVGEPTTGLAGYWSFDEGSGDTIIDGSGNNNTGSIIYENNLYYESGFTPTYADGKGLFTLDNLTQGIIRWRAPREWFEWDSRRSQEIDPSLDIFEMRYKNYVGGPDTLTFYYRDNEDCIDIPGNNPACSQIFALDNSNAGWQTLSEKITDPEWVDYNVESDALSTGNSRPDYFGLYFTGQTTTGPMEFDYVRFAQDSLGPLGGTCSFTLDANEARYIPITFEPTAQGEVTGIATVGDASSGGLIDVSLTGVGELNNGGLAITPTQADFGIVQAGSDDFTVFALNNNSGTTINGEIVKATSTALKSSGNGLLATYHEHRSGGDIKSTNLTPLATWVDNAINYNWGSDSPNAGLWDNRFAVRWDGKIEATETGDFVFWMGSSGNTVDNRMWIFIDGVQVGYCEPHNYCQTSPVDMIEGNFYDIRIIFSEGYGDARAQLSWQLPSSGVATAVPPSQLYTNDFYENVIGGAGGDLLSAPFTCDEGCAYTIPPYSSLTRTLRFTPITSNDYSTSLYFSGSTGQTVSVTAEGSVNPIMQVEIIDSDGNIIGTCDEDIVACTTTVDFGEVNVGGTESYNFRVTNIGTNNLDGSVDPLASTAYTYTTGENYYGLGGGSSVIITVMFNPSPQNAGTREESITFMNTVTNQTIVINLIAVGIYEPIISVGSGILDLGSTRVGTFVEKNFIIVNRGRDMLIDHFVIPSSAFTCIEYQEVEKDLSGVWVNLRPPITDCNTDFSIARDQAVKITLRFSPIIAQSYVTTMTLYGIPEVQLILSGTGISSIADFIFEER